MFLFFIINNLAMAFCFTGFEPVVQLLSNSVVSASRQHGLPLAGREKR